MKMEMKNIHVDMLRNALETFHVDPKKINSLCTDLQMMITRHESPSTYWNLLSHGAFKECYDVDEDIVIKFAAEDNETEEEKIILSLAERARLGNIFLPSIFIPLEGDTLPIACLELDGYSTYYHYTWNSSKDDFERVGKGIHPEIMQLNYIMVQKRIDCTEYAINEDCDRFYRVWYNESYLVDENGEKVPFDIISKCGIFSKNWLRVFIRQFGVQLLQQLADFNNNNFIHDLHEKNIGYLKDGTPVILDWLS